MAFKLDWQWKSILILAGVILVLGAILTTLAVREAEREKLARERDLNQEQRRYATLLLGEIDALFGELEEKIRDILVDTQVLQDRQVLSDACRQSAKKESLIADIFLAGGNNELAFPLRDPLFLAAERRRLAGINLKKVESLALFRRAESAELITRNLPLAIQSYETLIRSIPDESAKALVLNRLARCLMKSGDWKQALRTYNIILKDHSGELSSGGVPLGIIALYQIVTITQKTDPENSGQIVLEFYDRLGGSEWPLNKAQFQFYRDTIRNMIETGKTESKDGESNNDFKMRWDELGRRADAKLAELTADEDLVEKIIPLVQARLLEFNRKAGEFSRFSEIIGDTLFLITALSFPMDAILGIRLDSSVLAEERLPLLLERIPTPEDWVVQVVDPTGRVVSGEKTSAAEASGLHPPFLSGFHQDFPPWKIRISQRYPHSADRLSHSKRNVYILIVFVVMAVLFFGGFLAIKSTAKELELARLKSEFVSTVSHEFRTPLMSIRYLSEMLDAGRVMGEDKKKIYYGKINKESERLSRLIENMLDFSKIEAGIKKYTFEDLSMKDLVEEVSERFKEYMANKKVNLKCEIADDLPDIHADREAVSRALFNLLDNAVKYSGKDPMVHLRARSEGDRVFLEVQDMGAGIRRDEQKKVFEKFYRSADPIHRNIEGSGIGLTLVVHIVKAHGGEVMMESDVGKGTRVTLLLPVLRKGREDGQDPDR